MSPENEEVYKQHCKMLTGLDVTWKNCVKMLLNVSKMDEGGISRCNDSEAYPRVAHFDPFYRTPCAAVEQNILRWVIPILMLLCTTGNVLALLIYRMPYFDGSSSVHFLRAKAMANIIFVNSRLLEVVHAWTDPASVLFEPFFWHSRSYIMTVSNISGTMSTWLTLLVTIETVMCISMPFTFRNYCTVKMTWTLLAITLFFSSCLNLALIPTSEVITNVEIGMWPLNDERSLCWYSTITYFTADSQHLKIVQQTLYWTQMFAVIMLPTIAMLICTVIIVRHFSLKAMGEQFSQRRKCVLRMTVSTTLSHLLLEGPATLTYSAAAIMGNGAGAHIVLCVLNHAMNLASIVNATIPFFVFLLCSEQFRHMTAVYLQSRLESNKDRRAHILSQAAVRHSARNNRLAGAERTLETKLVHSIAKL